MQRLLIYILLILFNFSLAEAQVNVSLSSGTATLGGSVNLTLSTSGSQVSSLEWKLAYPTTDVTGVSVAASSMLTSAGKSIACANGAGTTVCVIDGINQNLFGSGALAVVTVNISSTAPDANVPISVSTIDGSDGTGDVIAGTATSGSIAITKSAPALSGLSCTSATVASPGSVSCTVTLSSAASSSGLVVNLASSTSSVSVPASVTVPASSTSAGFTATAAAVSAAQSATLTASAGAVSKTFALTLNPATWSISGSAGAASATIQLSGASSASTTANSSGNYTFAGLANGTYTVTPSMSGVTFTPASQTVTINGANVTAPAFTAQAVPSPVTIDVQVSSNHASGTSISSATFSSKAANELLLALIAAGGKKSISVTSVSGAGLTWVFVGRTNVQAGTAEIWRAFAPALLSSVSVTAVLPSSVPASMTIMSFEGVDTSGTNGSGAIGAIASGNSSDGAPTASLQTTRKNSFVIGVGNDPHAATARTLGTGQTLIHQYKDAAQTFWMQYLTTPSAAAGNTATIGDTAPSADPYNLEICEILPLAISGTTAPQLAVPTTASNSHADPRTGVAAAPTASLAHVVSGVEADACTPGGIATLSGSGFTGQVSEKAASWPLPNRLAGVQLMINGTPAPLLFASDSRINFQCPKLDPGTPLEISLQPSSAAPVRSVMREAVPEIFTAGPDGRGVITSTSTGEITRSVQRGKSITIYASGLGTTAEVNPGEPTPSDHPIPVARVVTVVAGGVELEPAFAGLAPQSAGVYQVNVNLPNNLPSGSEVPLYLRVRVSDGTTVSSNTVKIAVE